MYKEVVLSVREKPFLTVNKGRVLFADRRFLQTYDTTPGLCERDLVEVMRSNFEFGGTYKGRLIFSHACS